MFCIHDGSDPGTAGDSTVTSVTLTKDSPWPEMRGESCSGRDHPSRWVIWTERDTGDGMRFACDHHLAEWIMAVADRVIGGVYR